MPGPRSEAPPAGTPLVFLAAALALCACTAWLLAHHYVNDYALLHWAKSLAILDADRIRVEYLGLVYPHLPFYLLFPFHYLPALDSGAAPYLASGLVAASLLAWWYRDLARCGYGRGARLACVALLAAHPFFLWAATTGTQMALTLALYYALCISLTQLVRVGTTRSYMILGFVITLCFFADERTVYLLIALLPLFPLLLPRNILQQAPIGAYMIAFTPWALVFLAWAYLNWLFLHDPWHFLTALDSTFRGAANDVLYLPWLRDYGPRPGKVVLVTLAYGLLAFPLLLPLLWQTRRDRGLQGAAAIAFLLPMLATLLATGDLFLPHPLYMLFLLAAAAMAALPIGAAGPDWRPNILVAALALSTAGGWVVFPWMPTKDMALWRAALAGGHPEPPYAAERALGEWLAANREPTMLDDRHAYAALVARGDARDLILPFSRSYKAHLLRRELTVSQIVAPDPRYRGPDQINEHYPNLYVQGMAGYRLVYNQPPWRVYQRDTSLDN